MTDEEKLEALLADYDWLLSQNNRLRERVGSVADWLETHGSEGGTNAATLLRAALKRCEFTEGDGIHHKASKQHTLDTLMKMFGEALDRVSRLPKAD